MSPQRVMITAAASGIGRTIARAFADDGAKVHVCDVDEEALGAFRQEIPEIAATHVNVRSEGEIEAWFDDALDDLGGLDVLVNNAGIKGPTALVDDIDYADWRECLEVCLDSHFLCARRAAPVMKAAGLGRHHQHLLDGRHVRLRPALALCGGEMGGRSASPNRSPSSSVPTMSAATAICPGAVRGERIDRVIAAEAEQRGVVRRGGRPAK